MAKISLIAAVSLNACIGGKNGMLWHFPEDFRFFKQTTIHKPIIMGRRTWDSLPKKPLPDRLNIVVSRQKLIVDGVQWAADLESAIQLAKGVPEIMIIGGGQIYAQAMSIASDLYITHIPLHVTGDVFFPRISPDEWQIVEEHTQNTTQNITLTFTHYQRR